MSHDFKQARRRKARLEEPETPQEPPHSVEAEQGVLGCLMLAPAECAEQCMAAFKKAGSEVFYDLRHQSIYEVFIALYERNKIADAIAVQEELRKRNQLAGVGGIVYLASLPDAVPSAANVLHYVEIVLEKYILRKMAGTCGEIVRRIYEHDGKVNELMDEIERDVMEVGNLRMSGPEKDWRAVALAHMSSLEEGWKNQFLGLSTGFRELDAVVMGLRDGQVLTIGAASSEGKSALAGNILAHNLQQKIPCGLFTLEMDAEEMFGRLASGRSRVPLAPAQRGMNEDNHAAYAKAMTKVRDWPIQVQDESGITIAAIHAKARRMVREGVRLIVIDYAQLVEAGLKGTPNRTQEVSHVTKRVKAMARELKVPVVLLSQLSRDHKKNNRPPRLDDLRESGSMEQDADKVILMHRLNQNDPAYAINTRLNVAKHRNGPRGHVDLMFNAPIFQFENLPDAEI
jgi:replicative DNA helicase